jgi:hypothetical protein
MFFAHAYMHLEVLILICKNSPLDCLPRSSLFYLRNFGFVAFLIYKSLVATGKSFIWGFSILLIYIDRSSSMLACLIYLNSVVSCSKIFRLQFFSCVLEKSVRGLRFQVGWVLVKQKKKLCIHIWTIPKGIRTRRGQAKARELSFHTWLLNR